MVESNESQGVREALRRARSALESGDPEEALRALLELREQGRFDPELDEAIGALRGERRAGEVESVVSWIDAELGAAEGDDESREGFARDSSQVTAVQRESISDFDAEELESVDGDFDDAGAEFGELPAASFGVVDEGNAREHGEGEEEEEEMEDEEPSSGEPVSSSRETERNPIVEEIALMELEHDEPEEPVGDRVEPERGDESSPYIAGDSRAEESETPESSGAMAALESEREMQDRQNRDRRISELWESEQKKPGGHRPAKPTPVEPGFAAPDLGETSDAIPDESSGERETSGVNEPLDDEEFYDLAEELSEVGEAEESVEEEPGGKGPGAPLSESGDSSRQSPSGPTSSFDRVGFDDGGAQPESREVSEGSLRMLEEAEALVSEGHYDSAHDIVRSVLDANPESERARDLLLRVERGRSGADGEADSGGGDDSEEEERSGEERLAARTDLDALPRQAKGFDELADGAVDHRMGFVLSMIDGSMTFDDLLELSSMSRDQTASLVVELLDSGLVEIDDD